MKPDTQATGDAAGGIDIDAWRERIRATTFSNYHLCMGEAIDREGNAEVALEHYQRAREVDHDCPEVIILTEELCRRSGLPVPDWLPETTPAGRERAVLRAAGRLMSWHRFDEAEALLQAQPAMGLNAWLLTALNPPDRPVFRALDSVAHVAEFDQEVLIDGVGALLDKAEKKSVKATQALTNLRVLTPDDTRLVVRANQAWRLLGDIDVCVQIMEDAVRHCERDFALDYKHALTLYEGLRFEASAEAAAALLERYGESHAARSMLATAQLALGRLEAAGECFVKALDQGAESDSVAFFGGIAFQAKGDMATARTLYTKAVGAQRTPHYDATTKAYLLHPEGRWDEAETLHRAAMEASPKDIWPLVDLAFVLLKQGRRADAGPLLDEALAIDRVRTGHAARLVPWRRDTLLDLLQPTH